MVNDQATPVKKIDGRGVAAGLVGAILVWGIPVVIGLLIYFVVNGKKALATGVAVGAGIGILVLSATCFVILSTMN
ncbi:MAG: hypothetical protein TUN42_00140 [Dehalogenimonas sp.]